MSESELQRRLRVGLPILPLVIVVLLVAAHTGDVREMAHVARDSQLAIRSEADFYRAPQVLGRDYAIVRFLRREVPPGTPISVRGRGAMLGRSQRFWLALLPEYPVSGGARLRVCADPCAEPGDRMLVRGDGFVLLERASGADSR